MIYEIRTYTLKPRSMAEVEKRWAECYPVRRQYSEAAGLFKTEFGPFRDKVKIDRLRNEILASLKENGLAYQESNPENEKRRVLGGVDDARMRRDPNFAYLGKNFPPIRFEIPSQVKLSCLRDKLLCWIHHQFPP